MDFVMRLAVMICLFSKTSVSAVTCGRNATAAADRGTCPSGEVEIPAEWTTIPSQCFYLCYGITSVKIHDLVTDIGYRAFLKAYSLATIELGKGLKTIGAEALSETAFVSFEWPSTVTEVSDRPLYGCPNLKSVTFPDTVTKMGTQVLAVCNVLETVKLSSKMTSIGTNLFTSCPAIKTVTWPASCPMIPMGTFQRSGLVELTIPATVTVIGVNAFHFCKSLTKLTCCTINVTIDSTCTNQCDSLKKVSVPENFPYDMFGNTTVEKSDLTAVCPVTAESATIADPTESASISESRSKTAYQTTGTSISQSRSNTADQTTGTSTSESRSNTADQTTGTGLTWTQKSSTDSLTSRSTDVVMTTTEDVSTSHSSTSTTTAGPSPNSNSSKLTGGEIAGIVIGVIAFVAIIVIVVIVVVRKRKSASSTPQFSAEDSGDSELDDP